MEVRITYRNEIYLKGETLKDIKDKWESLNLNINSGQDPSITGFDYIDTLSVEDSNFNNLEEEWDKL